MTPDLRTAFFLLLLAVPTASLCPAQILRVPTQYSTIQAALNNATSGSIVLVAAGTYKERITWPATDGIELRAAQGPAATIIDGNQGGTVMTLGSGLSRATIVRGFTIRNGLLKNANNRNYGAGIVVDRGAPTFAGNRITANVSVGIYWNYGGGAYVTGSGANPLFLHNEIDSNILRDGSWNYGAGIYVASGAKAEIVGNRIHGNTNETPTATSGRGHGAGIHVEGTALVASNLVYANTNKTAGWNYGAGLRVTSSGNASVFNNTFFGNTCTSGSWTYGGGLHLDAAATVSVIGNIVAGNTVSNSNYVQGGGIYVTGATTSITLDYNDVWSNTGGNYQGISAGTHSISQDPKFAAASDPHLTAASPCVDAMPANHLAGVIGMDADGDPRRIDGDLDGGTGDGARLDVGADEYTDARLALTGNATPGSSVTFKVTATSTSLLVTALSLQTGDIVIEPWGNLLIGGSILIPWSGATPWSQSVSIPNQGSLVGVTVYAQSLVSPVTKSASQLTNRVALRVY